MEGMSAEFRVMYISVDGSLANPHVLIAVILWAACVGVITAVAIVRGSRRQLKSMAVLLATLAPLCVLTPWAQLRIAWLVQTIAAGQMISTTFFDPPPAWFAPATGAFAGTVSGVSRVLWNRYHTQQARFAALLSSVLCLVLAGCKDGRDWPEGATVAAGVECHMTAEQLQRLCQDNRARHYDVPTETAGTPQSCFELAEERS